MGSSSKKSSDRLQQLVILLALSLLFFLPKLGMPFLDPDEGFYSAIALDTLKSGDWLVPRLKCGDMAKAGDRC